MRFAVDAHAIGRHLTGNEVYIRNLLTAYASLDKTSQFLTYISGKEAEAVIPRRFQIRQVSANPFVRLGYQMGAQVRRDQADLLHVQYTSPLFCPVPTVVSVHDVSFLEHPEYFTWKRRKQLSITVAGSVKRAACVITGSEFARDSIIRAYPAVRDRVVVIPDAASPSFRTLNRVSAIRQVQERFKITAPFVLSVGDLQPRKNHMGLIRAFAALTKERPDLKHHLILAGKDTWHGARVREVARESGVSHRIQFPGFVTDDDLLQLYNACDCFAFPSYYEGFGIPILEAMACGRAVVTANTSSIPEVADGAGILFDPYRDEEITRALRDVLCDTELRARLERLGLQRATHFSWQKTAEATLEVYRQVAAGTSVKLLQTVTALRP